jgi:hypothetical protein
MNIISVLPTMLVFMEVAATNATPLDGYEDFVVFWLRLGYIQDANISAGKELCCLHIVKMDVESISRRLLWMQDKGVND